MKYKLNRLFCFIVFISSLHTSYVLASVPSHTTFVKDSYSQSQLTPSDYDHLPVEQQKTLAEIWSLTPTDYSRYLSLMQNTPNGLYYQDKNLDPSWILGFNAKDETELNKFVTIAIKNERLRISRELAFQKAFDEIQRKLYPDEKPIRLEAAFDTSSLEVNQTANTILQTDDNLLLFTDISNPSTQRIIEKILFLLPLHSGAKLNIYLVGEKLNDEVIRAWAARNKIPVNLVKNNTVTLNHDDGRFHKLTQGKNELPLLNLSRGKEVTAIDVNNLS